MLIRSQDKKSLFNSKTMENIQINKDTKNDAVIYCVAIYFTENEMATIGRYSTESKAIEVIDMIVGAYSRFSSGNTYTDAVFDIPQDSEVGNAKGN